MDDIIIVEVYQTKSSFVQLYDNGKETNEHNSATQYKRGDIPACDEALRDAFGGIH